MLVDCCPQIATINSPGTGWIQLDLKLPNRPTGKTLDRKLEKIRSGHYAPQDFIIADAKDPGMAFAITGMGPNGHGGWKSRTDFVQSIQDVCTTGVVDIMLTSASNGATLAERGHFADSQVTLAKRGNDNAVNNQCRPARSNFKVN